jgi:serine/threonine protein phosphatase PrpC
MLRFEVFARTEVGCARERNEDSFLVLNLATGESGLQPQARVQPLEPPGTILGVCDGMGGAAAGDVAARIALGALERVMRERTPLEDVEAAEVALLAVVTTANRAVLDHAKQHPEKRGMGTTMTVATLFGPDVVIVQVGDSRAYVRRGNMLQQLTMDQNVVGQMIATGRLSPEQARTSKQRNMLLEAIGVQERVGPDIVRVRMQAGDVLLLCSDGLTGPLEDRKVLELLIKHPEPVKACRALTEAACALGGPDNVTVAIAKVLGDPGDSFAPEGPIAFTRRPAVA